MDYADTSIITCDRPLISVILPVFNCEQYVAKCIESILGQTYTFFELIIINDGSTDRSGDICNSYIYDNRVKVYHQDNRGLSYARNLGCEKASGSHIMFVDSDDYVHYNSLACYVDIYQKTRADIIVADFLRVHDHQIADDCDSKLKYAQITADEAISNLFSDTHDVFKYGTAWGKLFNIALLRKHPFPIGKYWEDVFVLYRLYDDSSSIVVTDKVLYYYYLNPNGITSSPFGIRNLDYLDGMKERLLFLQEHYAALYNVALARYIDKCNEYLNKAQAISNYILAEDIRKRIECIG